MEGENWKCGKNKEDSTEDENPQRPIGYGGVPYVRYFTSAATPRPHAPHPPSPIPPTIQAQQVARTFICIHLSRKTAKVHLIDSPFYDQKYITEESQDNS